MQLLRFCAATNFAISQSTRASARVPKRKEIGSVGNLFHLV